MKKQVFSLLILLLSIISLSGCVFSTTGESLEAFSKRMNEKNESYNMTSEGYIVDTKDCELTKFFKFSRHEMMLSFKYDKKHRLNEMNIVFETDILDKSPESLIFIYDCIKCFVQDEKTEKDILNGTDFKNSIRKINMQTKSTESGNIRMEIDTTELGTVITIYKDI